MCCIYVSSQGTSFIYLRPCLTICINKILTTMFWIICVLFGGGKKGKWKCEDFYFVVDLPIPFIDDSLNPFFNTVVFIWVRKIINHYLLLPEQREHNITRWHLEEKAYDTAGQTWPLVGRMVRERVCAHGEEEAGEHACAFRREHSLFFTSVADLFSQHLRSACRVSAALVTRTRWGTNKWSSCPALWKWPRTTLPTLT